MKRGFLIAIVVAGLAFGFAGTAKADSFTFTVQSPDSNDGSITVFTATITSTSVAIDVTCSNVKCQGNFLDTVVLKGLSFTSLTDDSAGDPAGFGPVQNGGGNVGTTGNCNNTQLDKAVCWTSGNTAVQIGSGGLHFFATLTDGADSPTDIHLQAIAFSTSDATATGGTRVFAISNGPDTGTTPTPEPASLMLLGLGMVGVPFLRRKR